MKTEAELREMGLEKTAHLLRITPDLTDGFEGYIHPRWVFEALDELLARIEELKQAFDYAEDERIEYVRLYEGANKRADEAEAALATHLMLCRQPKVRTQLEYDLAMCREAAQKANEAAALANEDNERLRAKLAAAERERDTLQDEIAKVHHWLLEMFEFFWHDGNSRTHLSIINWLEQPHSKKWLESVAASETREMQKG